MVLGSIWFLSYKPEYSFHKELINFHTVMVGEDSVNNFHRAFPFIVSDDYVYLAYLQQEYYKTHYKQIINLIKYDYYKRTGFKPI